MGCSRLNNVSKVVLPRSSVTFPQTYLVGQIVLYQYPVALQAIKAHYIVIKNKTPLPLIHDKCITNMVPTFYVPLQYKNSNFLLCKGSSSWFRCFLSFNFFLRSLW